MKHIDTFYISTFAVFVNYMEGLKNFICNQLGIRTESLEMFDKRDILTYWNKTTNFSIRAEALRDKANDNYITKYRFVMTGLDEEIECNLPEEYIKTQKLVYIAVNALVKDIEAYYFDDDDDEDNEAMEETNNG